MKTLLVAVIIIAFYLNVIAQDSNIIASNSVYIELLGNGVPYSLNFDRIVVQNPKLKIAARIGISYMPTFIFSNRIITIPLELTTLVGEGKHFFEFGPGFTFMHQKYDENDPTVITSVTDPTDYVNIYLQPSLRFGYRYQKPDGGFLFRLGLLGITSIEIEKINIGLDLFYLWGGISIGYTLRNKVK